MTVPPNAATHFAAFHDHLLASGRSPETAKTYGAAVNVFASWWAAALETVQHADLEAYVAHERSRLSQNTLAARIAALRAFFAFLGKSNLTEGLRVRREELAPQRPFSEDDLAQLFGAASERDQAMMLVALDCGLRVSELLGIQLEDVDLGAETVVVRGKGSKQRRLHLSARCRTTLRRFCVRPNGPLWRVQDGGALTVAEAKRELWRIGKRAGVADCHWHRFRTTFAHRFLERSRGDIDSLRQLMGHSKIETTAHYTAYGASQRALEQMRRLDG